MPQITSSYLDQEDNVLDYCRSVNFNRGNKGGIMHRDANPNIDVTEIDGDAFQSVINAKP